MSFYWITEKQRRQIERNNAEAAKLIAQSAARVAASIKTARDGK